MDKYNLLPDQRLELIYDQIDTIQKCAIDNYIARGRNLKFAVKQTSKLLNMANEFIKKADYINAFQFSLKCTTTCQHIKKSLKNSTQPLSQIDNDQLVKNLLKTLDYCEKLKPRILLIFKTQNEAYNNEILLKKQKSIEKQKAFEIEKQKKNDENKIEDNTSLNINQNTTAPKFNSEYFDQFNQLQQNETKYLLLPSNLTTKFRKLATNNTFQNIETCGFLFGKKIEPKGQFPLSDKTKYQISHLFIPKQTGTSDTCTPIDEMSTMLFACQNDLIQLGWIHTHPSQTAFLSSVDMHTQFSFQVLLDSAVAIVCSDKYSQDKYLKLTNYGMDTVKQHLNSKNSSTFFAYDKPGDMQVDMVENIDFVGNEVIVVDQR